MKTLPARTNHNCFACSPANPSGLQMKFFTDDKSVFSRLTVPAHLCGWDRLVHGGVISTILDEIMSWAAIYLLKTIILTKSITVDFLKPVYIGDTLEVRGKILEYKNDREAVMEGFIYNIDQKLCSKSTGTFVLIPSEVAKKMRIVDEETLKYMELIFNT